MSEQAVLTYRGKPLIRQGNFLFYGNPEDEYILFMNILESKKIDGVETATKVLVQVQTTDEDVPFAERCVDKKKSAEKKSLFDALEVGIIWLERSLKGKN